MASQKTAYLPMEKITAAADPRGPTGLPLSPSELGAPLAGTQMAALSHPRSWMKPCSDTSA